jgi:hypothetical protein
MTTSPATDNPFPLFLRVEQLLSSLRPTFTRAASFRWFLLLVWAMLLRPDGRGITSCLYALGLAQSTYHRALHFFRSNAFSNEALTSAWHRVVLGLPVVWRLNGRPVYVSDGIKIAKEGRRMPGVKRLHQESGNTAKPPWIRGHYFGALGMLLGGPSALFHCPLTHEIQDGLEGTPETDPTIVERTTTMIRRVVPRGGIVVLDAFFAAASLLSDCAADGIDVITRVRSTTVAYRPLPPPPDKRPRGRPRLWGERVRVSALFDEPDGWHTDRLRLYDKTGDVAWKVVDLYWHRPDVLVRFVLSRDAQGRRAIFIATSLDLSGPEIITAYAWRFKIEVNFRAMHQTLFAFDYHFWLKPIDRAARWSKNLDLSDCSDLLRAKIRAKIAAYERFVNLAGIALGVLQILALEQPERVLRTCPRWFRTLPQHGLPTELVVRMTLQHHAQPILQGSGHDLLLTQFLAPLRQQTAATEASAA